MSDELRNKSLEDLQKEKVQAEIDILKARLEKEFPDEKPPGRFDKVADFARKWSAFVLGSVTLISAIFGVFVPLSEYLAEQRRALSFELNENMIGFVNDLQTDSLANRGVVMLSYYEENSIPILLFYLESSGNTDEEFREKIIETISRIYVNKSSSDIFELIMTNIQNSYDQVKNDFIAGNDSQINPRARRAFLNYLDLITGMKLSKSDSVKVNELYVSLKEDICATEGLTDELFTTFMIICLYLDVEMECN